MWQTMRFLMNEPVAAAATAATTTTTSSSFPPLRAAAASSSSSSAVQGLARLWRGVEAILVGCIPAHALYFSAYEIVKAATRDPTTHEVTTWGSSLAGAAAVLGHDAVMTPLDTVKQRMQLGHYRAGVQQAFAHIYRTEGWQALYRSLPITLLSNIPYGMVMVSTHEFCIATLLKDQHANQLNSWQTVLVASSMGGFTAAALTTPLDRLKTSLQTQELAPACLRQIEDCPKQQWRNNTAAATTAAPRYTSVFQAAQGIYQQEGIRGFARGWLPRVLSHTPAVAISWTTYEMTKQALLGQ
jgi:solute carrier family 25 iron transporter 28/37